MRHQTKRTSLGVTREHRAAMLSNLAVGLITHGRIQTTLSKARALRPFIEKVITKAKKASTAKDKKDAIHLRRLAIAEVRDKEIIALLFNEKVKDFAGRAGGYTRIYKLSPQRVGDAAEMAIIEFVKADDVGYKKSRGKKAAEPKAEAPAAAAPADAEAPAAEAKA